MKANKIAPFLMRLYVVITLFVFTTISSSVFAQVDFEFWFAAPYASMQHNPNTQGPGGRPIYMRIATQDAPANVVLSMPANPSFTPISLAIPANQSSSIDLTPYISQVISSNQGNVIENKGIFIHSDALITAYYEIASVLNGDFFSLKGKNALGTDFYAPTQNKYYNSDWHNVNHNDPYGLYTIADPAYSYIIITATENNTQVQITPTGDAVGIPAGTTQTVVLRKGETYVVRSVSSTQMPRLGGTHITSNKKVAVTIGDDSMYPQDFTISSDCEDYAGDQIIPTNVIGKEYWVVKGQGAKTLDGKDYTEQVFVTATKPNTVINVDGAYFTTLNAGQQVAIDLGGASTSDYKFIEASEPVYAFQISGYQCEMAGAILPPVDKCTGSYKTGFYRTYGTQPYENFWMNLMVKGNGQGDFLIDGAPSAVISGATFQTIDGTDWKVARIEFTQAQLPPGPHYITNTSSLFHMGMMNSRSFDWGVGYGLMGASFAYFSNFNDNVPRAIIVNNNDTAITVARGTRVSLFGDGGYAFSWTGYLWNGSGWDMMTPPYFMNNTNVENPYVILNADGVYKYTASITTECYGVQNRSVYIKIVPPANLNDIRDTVCATAPYTNISEFYNLFNLNDTIVGKQGMLTGYYVDRWYKWVDGRTEIWDDFETNRNVTGIGLYTATPLSPVANPTPDLVNSTSQVLYLKKTGTTDPNGMNFYGFDQQQTRLGVVYEMDLTSNPISIAEGHLFTLDVKFDGTTFQGWELPAQYDVYLQMIDGYGTYGSVIGGSLTAGGSTDWAHLTFDFTGYENLTQVTKARIVIKKSNSNWANTYPGFYIDNLTRFVPRHKEVITQPYQYRITDGDTIIALVKNYFDITRLDSANVYFAVDPPGMGPKNITVSDTCATSGNYISGFDLTNYNYEVGGALVADKIWYLDNALSVQVPDPTNVTVSGTQTFWAKIEDECGGVGSLTIEVSPLPNVMNGTVQICENVALGGDRGILDLTTMTNRVTTNLDATIRWYSDAAMTQLVPDLSQVFVEDGDVYYAKIYYSLACVATANLTVTVIPLDDITISGFTVCLDGGVRILSATPAGGVFSGTGVSGNQFNPAIAGEGSHEISYTISNLTCNYTEKVNAIVAPLVSASITQVPAGKLQVGQTATLNTTITPGPSSNYNFTWTNASLLSNPTSLNPTTLPIAAPTTFCITVTHKVTGCDDTVCHLVDAYVPVSVNIGFSANPVCAGTPVNVYANRIGGTGPYTYSWNIPVGTDYTMVNDSVVRLNNPTVNIPISVTVTDLGETPNDVATDSDVLTVYSKPVITIANPTPTVCQGAALSINPTVTGGSTPYTHVWSQDTQILTSATNQQTATVNTTDNTGTYYLRYTVTDAHSCTDFEDVTVKVNARPIVTAIANPDTTCVGRNVSILGQVLQGITAGGTHLWISSTSSTPELTSTNTPNPIFNTYTYGVHRFQYIFTDANGCKDTSDVVRVRIEPKPVVTINPVAAHCAGPIGVPLTANPTVPDISNPTFTYDWTGAVESTEASPILDISSAGTKNITLQVTANNGCTSDPATLSVIVNPNPVAQIINAEPLTVCANQDLTLQANSANGVVYTWDGTAKQYINPLTGSAVTFNAPSVNPTTVYNAILTATNSTTGCTSQDNIDITVFKLPQVTLGSDLELCVGTTTVLNPQITYVYSPSYSIRWVLDTTELSSTGALNPLFTQRELRDYTIGIRITDEHNCSGYDEMLIHGLGNPTANAGNDTIVDWAAPFNLNGSATGGTPSYTWSWQPEDSLTSVNTVSNPSSVLQNSTWFELEVTDAKGCKDIDSVLVTVVGQPINVTILQHPPLICLGDNAQLEAVASGGTGVYTYEWYQMPDATTVIGTDKFLPITPSQNTQYMVRVSSGPFTPASATHNVLIAPLPSLSIINSANKEICLNSTVLIEPTVSGGTGPYTYEWNDGSPFVITTPTYTYNNSTSAGVDIVNLEVTDANGCKNDIDVSITVNPLPQVTILPVDPTVCVNNDLTLTAQVTGGEAPYAYAWTESTGKLTPMGSTALFNSSVAGPYFVNVMVSDQNSCTANASEIVVVKPLSTLALQNSYNICAGADLLLDINPNNIPGNYTMHWVGGNRNYIVDSVNILKSKFRSNDEGTFELYYTIADVNGCPRLDTVEIVVYPAVQIATLPDLEACVGVSLPIQANVITAGNPATLTYSWIINSGLGTVVPTSGQNTTFTASVQGTTNIRVIAGDRYCNDSTSFTVTVHPNPIVEITTNVQPTNVPFSAEVTLYGNIQTYTTAPFTYSWEQAAAITSGQGTPVVTTIPITSTRTYTFNLEDAYGCTASDDITLSTQDIIVEIWHPCNPTQPIQPNVIVDGSVVCLNKENEICMGQSIRLVPQFISGDLTGLTYQWTDDDGNNISTDINPSVRPTKEITIYTLTVTNSSGYSKSATFLVQAHPLPTANILVSPEYNGNFYIDMVLNIDGNPESDARGLGETHTWLTDADYIFNRHAEITFIEQNTPKVVNLTYTYVDTNSCSVTVNRSINVIRPIVPIIISPDVCEDDTVTYSIDRVYPPGTRYVWTVNGGQIVGVNNEPTLDVYWSDAGTGSVSVYIQPPNDMAVQASVVVNVGRIPDVSISGPVHVCQGDIVDYTAINNGTTEIDRYSWFVATDISSPLFEPYYSEWWDGVDNQLLTSVNAPANDVATVTWKNVGQDKVVLRAYDGGCGVVVDLDVTIHPLPQPDFTFEPVEMVYFQQEDRLRHTDSIFVDKQVDFTNTTADTANTSFYWDFIGDGVYTQNTFNASYEFDESGNFMTHLMAVDNVWGCKNVIAKPVKVIVNPNCGLTFPNAFTPDLSTNSTFYPVYNEGVLETGYELRIYNRWGTLLWTTTDKHAQWDGMYKGELSKQDVYVYHCKAVCEEKDPVTGEERVLNIKGDVTVIR